MTIVELYDRADRHGVQVDDVPMRVVSSVSFPDGWIALDTARLETDAEEKVALAHELGHVETGSFYNLYSPYDIKAKHERRADKRAIQLLVPREDLRRAVRSGISQPWDLADHFGVTEAFMRKAMEYYRNA